MELELLLLGCIVVVLFRFKLKNISHRVKYIKCVIFGGPPNYTEQNRRYDIFLDQTRSSSS